ncbi:MAG: hypothetical protein JSW71_00540 [Gemmatimonadota bacterium]|nr:MAG: hypothetical protein JSW71_00540 [Gemmatimonadota bacterium]
MLREAVHGVLLALPVVSGLTGSARAQAEHSLRYAPDIPARVNLISRSEITMTIMPTGQELLDTLTIEAIHLESATLFSDAAANGRFSVVLQYDSVRARMRPQGGLWQQLEVAEEETATVRAVLDERLQVLQAEFLDSPHLQASRAHMARGLNGGLLLALPVGLVTQGMPWTVDVTYPFSTLRSIGQEEGVPRHGELTAHATARIDSLASHGSDTLYYLTVRGSFVPAQFASRLSGTTAVTTAAGSFAAMMVWSSARSVFVSSASRVVLRLDVGDSQRGETSSQVRFDVITRSQVRM